MNKKISKNLVLVYSWCVNDNWYGQRFRIILFKEKGKGFLTKTEIHKHKTPFKNFINKKYEFKIKIKDLEIGDIKEFPDYTYCACGPSLSYNHREMTIQEMLK